MKDGKDSGPHFSQVVAPVLAAFTLPTIAVIITLNPPPHFGNIILALFAASTGLLLASFQFAVGRLFRDTTGWGAFRAFLAGLGLILLGIGLCLLVLSWNGEAETPETAVPYAGNRDFLYAGLAVLGAGIIVPILINLWLFFIDLWLYAGHRLPAKKFRIATKIGTVLENIRRVAEKIRLLRWIHHFFDPEYIDKWAIDQTADKGKPEYRSKHPWAVDVDQEFSKENKERLVKLKLMQAYPSAGDINYILRSMCYSSSPFEKDQALRAAIKLIPQLSDCDWVRLL